MDEAYATAATEDPSGLVRSIALRNVPSDRRVALALGALQHDPDPRVRATGAAQLDCGEGAVQARVHRALEAALDDPEGVVRRAAHQALRHVSPECRQLSAQRARAASLARAQAECQDQLTA